MNIKQKYKAATALEFVKNFSCKVLAYAISHGLDIDGIKVWISPGAAIALELDEYLIIEYQDRVYELPVITDGAITETPLEIHVGNPDWKINMAEGELWF